MDEAFELTSPVVEIGLPSADAASMKRFYCDGLGFQPFGTVDLPAAHIEGFRLGRYLIKATVFANEALRPRTPREPNLQAPYISIRVSDIRAVVSRCAALGYELIVPLSTAVTAKGHRVEYAFFADPMGTRVELVEGDAWHQEA